MEQIRELLNILRNWGYSSTPVPKLPDNEKPPEIRKDKVLRDIETGNIKSTDDAAKKYWDGPKANRNATSALSDYTKELVHAILFLDISSTTIAVKAFRQCFVYLFAGQLLVKIGYRSPGCKLLEKSLSIARKMEFNEERAIALKYLENHYNRSIGINASQKAIDERMEALNLVYKEAEIRYLYRELNFHTSREMNFSRIFAKKAFETERKADKIFNKYKSFNIRLYWYDIKQISNEIRGDYRQALHYVLEAKDFFSNILIKHVRFREAT